MGSHYIPVGKIKIDKGILDIVCPAAGYDETPPDPAIYCPANGYNQPEEVYESPLTFPDPSDEQILLLVSDMYEGAVTIRSKTSAGNTKIDIMNSSMTVLSSFIKGTTSLTTIDIDLPTIDTGLLYIIRLSPNTVGASLLEFRTYTRVNRTNDWMILEAKFNTPNLENFQSAFQNLSNFKLCTFYSEMPNLTSLNYAFDNSGIERIKGVTIFENVTLAQYIFRNTSFLKKMDMSDWYMPNAALVSGFENSRVEEVILSQNSGILGYYSFANSALKKLIVPVDYQFKGYANKLSYCFSGAVDFQGTDFKNKTITIRGIEDVTTLERFLENCKLIKKVIFEGEADSVTNVSRLCYNNSNLEELILPSSMNLLASMSSSITGTPRLKKIQLPLSMESWNAGWTNASIPNSNVIQELTTCEIYADVDVVVRLYGTKWEKVSQPSLKLKQLIIGNSATDLCNNLQEFDFDFENSPFSGSSPMLALYSSNLTATQLNALYTRLPDFTGDTTRTLSLNSNIGYAASDKSIFENKNWIHP